MMARSTKQEFKKKNKQENIQEKKGPMMNAPTREESCDLHEVVIQDAVIREFRRGMAGS